MARTSRKHLLHGDSPAIVETFRTGIYVRLSGKESDIETLENQEALIRNYLLQRPEFKIVDVYRDHGKTGVNFERDGFKRLKRDLDSGIINAVIVKDLSRFARNHIGAGEFFETFFTNFHIRFIAINDKYDSFSATAVEQQTIHLTNLANELYAQDISGKILPVIRAKQERGEFLGGWPAYGYARIPNEKNGLIIDQETSGIVQKIFNLKLSGMSNNKISRLLNEEKIPSPSRYRYEKGLVQNERFKNTIWKGPVIKVLLQNEVYLGHKVQGKKRESLKDGEKQRKTNKDEWIRVENTHEPIIEKDIFDKVQSIIEGRTAEYNAKQGVYDDIPHTENTFQNLIRCSECGSILVRYRKVRRNKDPKNPTHQWYTYICPTHANALDKCSFTSIKENLIKETLFQVLKVQTELASNYKKVLNHKKFKASQSDKMIAVRHQITTVKQEELRVSKLKSSLYDSYLNEIISDKEYTFMSEEYSKQLSTIHEKLLELDLTQQIESAQTPNENQWLKNMILFGDFSEISRDMVSKLVEKITVIDQKHIQIDLKFRDEYKNLCEILEKEDCL